ncbi:BTAD domain-containing putative transcriptional regulator [Streptomyces sp. NPDC057027]|uniref:AfsR/SARP family transcriptional regulator n=1 Tax=Streptomyces sp. NPDC057027 TaxID=3346004 RepID=UPI0036432861
MRLLGRFRLEYDAAPVELCGNAQRLLAFVGVHGRVGRSVLAGALWPDVPEERARGSLRTTLWKLPRGDRPLLRCTRETMDLADAVDVDAHALADTALKVLHSRDPLPDPRGLLDLLVGADLLPDWDDEWIVLEREWLRQLRLLALDALSERLARQGRPALALEVALASVGMEPLRESAHRAVVSAHLAGGNVTEAVRRYDTFRGLLRRELGAEPSLRFTRMIPLRVGSPASRGGRSRQGR